MASDKAWYWVAAGVLALGLNGAYQDGQFGWAHSIADRSTEVVERASERGLQFVTMTEVMLGRNPGNGWTEAALHGLQGKLDCRRVEMVQRQMDMAQRQMDMAQMQRDLVAARVDRQLAKVEMKMDKVRMVTIERPNGAHCAGTARIVVSVPNVPGVDLSNLPDVEIPDVPEMTQEPSERANGPI